MQEKEFIQDLENKVIEKLTGRFNLLQTEKEKQQVVTEVLDEVCGHLEKKLILEEVKALETEQERRKFVQDFLAYDVIQDLLCDPDIEDIIINSLNTIYVHHSQKGLIRTKYRFESQRQLDIFIKKLIVFCGRAELKKINNMELPNIQGRVNIIFSPLGPQITITKAKTEPMSMIDLIDKGTVNPELAAQMWLYVEGLSARPANIIISGGPGCGKTTLLNALFSFVPENERMVVIEDTLELNTQFEESCSRLESDDNTDMTTLVKNSLRMRPDRVIVGEVRGAEAKDLMTVVNIGKHCIGTIHASSSREAILRLQNEPMNVPEILVNLVDVFIIMKRFNFNDRVYRVAEEVVETGGMEQRTVLLSQIWNYDHKQNKFNHVSPSTIYRDKLSKTTGLSPKEIIDEVKVRSKILTVLHERNIRSMKELTLFCRAYSKDPASTLAKLGIKREELL
ncbi:MAG: CpaF family protein [Candidatus Omnitrophica bacterium]|nr:CpaF family protein [Candidatus Omnitrophota bacterium]